MIQAPVIDIAGDIDAAIAGHSSKTHTVRSRLILHDIWVTWVAAGALSLTSPRMGSKLLLAHSTLSVLALLLCWGSVNADPNEVVFQGSNNLNSASQSLYQAAQISFSAKLDDDQLKTIEASPELRGLLAKAVSQTIFNHQKGSETPLANSVIDLRIIGIAKRRKTAKSVSQKAKIVKGKPPKELVDIKLEGHISLV